LRLYGQLGRAARSRTIRMISSRVLVVKTVYLHRLDPSAGQRFRHEFDNI
jgi:hypothetical protein